MFKDILYTCKHHDILMKYLATFKIQEMKTSPISLIMKYGSLQIYYIKVE